MRKPIRLKRPTNTKIRRPIRLKRSTNTQQLTNLKHSERSNQIRSKIQDKIDFLNVYDSIKIKLDRYKIKLERKGLNTIELSELYAIKKAPQNYDLPIIINGLKEIARNKGYTKIKGFSWIFAEHPTIAKRLGVTVDPKKLIEFNRIKRKHNIVKINGLNDKKTIFNFNLYQKFGDYIAIDCIVKTDNGPINKTIKIPSKYIALPFEINI